MDNLMLILTDITGFIAEADKVLFISMAALVICLGIISVALFFANRKHKRIIQSNIDYTSKTGLISKLTDEINILSEDKRKLEIAYDLRKEQSDRLLNEHKTLLVTIKEKELLISKLNNHAIELEIKIEALKRQIIDEEITLLEFDNKIKEATQNLDTLNVYNYRTVTEVNLLKESKTLIETERAALSDQKNKLELEIQELETKIQLQKENIIKLPNLAGTVHYIGFTPNQTFQRNSYPAVMMPQPGSVIKFPREGRTGPRGFAEPGFEKYLEHYFKEQNNIQLYSDRLLVISDHTRPHETGFTLLDEKDNLNLVIDIEIDAPYDENTGLPTHFKGQDDERNQFFNNRGWVVIRFTERQVHLHPKACCKVIAEVIAGVNPGFVVPEDLQLIAAIEIEDFWSKEKAEQWAKGKYRENYLMIDGFPAREEPVQIPAITEQTPDETEAEKNVVLPSLPFIRTANYNEIHALERDKKIERIKEPKQYKIGNDKLTVWASALVKKMLGTNAWSNEPVNLDEETHLNIHHYIKQHGEGMPQNDVVFDQFRAFYNHHFESISPYRTNWKIYDDETWILGTIDLLSDNRDGTFSLYNWKINGNIQRNPHFTAGDLIFEDAAEYNYVCYSLEMNIYKRILEQCYHLPISNMYFVQFHPTLDAYRLYPVEIMNKKTDALFQFARENNKTPNP